MARSRSTARSRCKSTPTGPAQEAEHATVLPSWDRLTNGAWTSVGCLMMNGGPPRGGETVHSSTEVPVSSASMSTRSALAAFEPRLRLSARVSPPD